jgi:drug/metabolite transporter (DMT)-like permease
MSSPRAYLAWVAVCILWGTTYLAIRIAIETIPPLLMTSARWVAAGAVLIVVLKVAGVALPAPRSWPALTVLGVFFMGMGNGLVVWAEQTVPSGLAAVLVAVIPFYMLVVEKLMGASERVTSGQAAGLIVGFGGIVMLVWPGLIGGGETGFLFGVIATQLACLGWALGSSYARRRHAEENVLAAAALQMVFGGIVVFGVALVSGEWHPFTPSARSLLAVLYLMVFGSIAGFSAYVYALKHLPVSTVSLYAYINPAIAVLLGSLVLGEPFSARIVLAGGIVLAGTAMVKQFSDPAQAQTSSSLRRTAHR